MRDDLRLRHLAPRERDALTGLISWLREKWSDGIAHVWLFGSKARGDSDAESDVDLLIVAIAGDDELREEVGRIAYDLSLEHGVLLCEHVVSGWRFAQMRARREPLYRNISREGIDLWASETVPTTVTEDRTPYDVEFSEEKTHQVLEQAERTVARLDQFLCQRSRNDDE